MPSLPDLKNLRNLPPNKYEHRRPRRPTHLPRRLKPPPDRSEPPDLTLFLYAGLALAVIVLIIAIPYLISYLVDVLSR